MNPLNPTLHSPRTRDRSVGVRGALSAWRVGLACGLLVLAGVMAGTTRIADAAAPANTAASAGAMPAIAPTNQRQLPRVSPDYTGVVIPPNLAPLNFVVREPGAEFRLRVAGLRGRPLELQQTNPQVRLPLRGWQELLLANRGAALTWRLGVRDASGVWTDFTPFENQVAQEEIDPYLVYRRLHPLYTSYRYLGIYQRDLRTFEEKPVVRNEKFDHGCVNCHTFLQGSPDRFAISFRGKTGTPTLLIDSNRISRIDAKLGYLSWHPSGKLLVYSENTITQFFHLAGPLNRDIHDPRSDLKVVFADTGKIEKPAAISRTNHSENWPSWSPDGRHLYYCSGPTLDFRDEKNFRHDLLRIPYDVANNRWGEPETLFSSAEHHQSAHQPRVSPDGRFLVFTVSDSGSFPAFRRESDLYLMRLADRKLERLTINSDQADTWHGWSSNGRWLLFGSRRLDGVFARPFITHVDSEARFSKPLVIPQEDPTYYETCLDNFNAPELARGPIRITEDELVDAFKTRKAQSEPGANETMNPSMVPEDPHP